MFKQAEFNLESSKTVLEAVKERFTYEENSLLEDVHSQLDQVNLAMKVYTEAPKLVITNSLYEKGEGVLDKVSFVIKPSIHETLKIIDMKHKFVLNGDENFFNKYIDEVSEWFDRYNYYKRLEVNIDELNAVMAEIIEENEIPFSVQFTLGQGLVDASDDYALVGLSAEVIEQLASLPLFDQTLETRSELYREKIVETLQACFKPYEIVKIKSLFTTGLNIYSRKSLSKLMRKFVNRKSAYVRVGVGYVDENNQFAVVEKTAVTEEELSELDQEDIVVLDNVDPSSREKKEGKTKIVVTFKVTPFTKSVDDEDEEEDTEVKELELSALV